MGNSKEEKRKNEKEQDNSNRGFAILITVLTVMIAILAGLLLFQPIING